MLILQDNSTPKKQKDQKTPKKEANGTPAKPDKKGEAATPMKGDKTPKKEKDGKGNNTPKPAKTPKRYANKAALVQTEIYSSRFGTQVNDLVFGFELLSFCSMSKKKAH